MEIQMDVWWNGALLLLLLLVAALVLSFVSSCGWWWWVDFPVQIRGTFPPSPPAWPIIGHLHLLATKLPPHQTLAALSPKYGPIIGLRLGSKPAVVVSSAALAREVLLKNDKAFANRPPFQLCSSLLYGYDTGITFSSYGPQWRKLRKICTLELLTTRQLQGLEYVRQEEVAGLLDRIREASKGGTTAIDIGKCVAVMSSNTLSRLVQSRRLSASQQEGGEYVLQELVTEVEREVAPIVGDLLPWLKWLDVRRKKRMKQIHDRLDKIFDAILMERKLQACMEENSDQLPHDFLHVLLSKEIQSHTSTSSHHDGLTAQEIKGIMLDILGAGIHTSALTLEWAMAELLRNPNCLRMLQKELNTMIGKGMQVSDADLPKLTYLKNTVKEVFRLHPAAPLLLPRISTQACQVGNYMLPINTHVFVNVWAIGRDPELWEKAHMFFPERFEDKSKEIDAKGQHYELLPFGSGRRACAGLPLGLSMVEVTLANLVNNFDWELPQGTHVDMSERRGITICKATPVLAIPKPRL